MTNETILRNAVQEATEFISRLVRRGPSGALRLINVYGPRLEAKLIEALERAPMPLVYAGDGPVCPGCTRPGNCDDCEYMEVSDD